MKHPTAAVILGVSIICSILVGCNASGAGDQRTSDMTTPSSTSPEAKLRTKPSFEDAQKQYEAEVRAMADGITALVPGMTWNMKENSWAGCGGEFVNTKGVQAYFFAAFDRPIPDDKWPQSLTIVKDGAARLSITNFGTYKDNPGNHDIYIGGPDGAEIRFGTSKLSSLTALSDCRLRQADLAKPSE